MLPEVASYTSTIVALVGCSSVVPLEKPLSISCNTSLLCHGTLIAILTTLLIMVIISTWPLPFWNPSIHTDVKNPCTMPGSYTVNMALKKAVKGGLLSVMLAPPSLVHFLVEGVSPEPSWRMYSSSGFACLYSKILLFLRLLSPSSLLCQVSSNNSTST